MCALLASRGRRSAGRVFILGLDPRRETRNMPELVSTLGRAFQRRDITHYMAFAAG